MKVILNLIYFLVLLFSLIKSCLGNNTVIYVKNCLNRSVAFKEGWSRSIMFDMVAYTTGDDIHLTWEIYKIDTKNVTHKVNIKAKYSRGYNFVLEPYSLGEGFYKILVLSTEQPKYKMDKDCFLRIRPERCFAFITGGYLREYRPAETIVVDGSMSKDYCYPEGSNNSLEYTWSCRQKLGSTYCPFNLTGTDSKFIIPEEYVIDREEFVITLTVENEDRFLSVKFQRIVIRNNILQYQIDCIRNCPPWSRVNSHLILSVKCTKYCENETCLSSWILTYRDGEISTQFGDQGICRVKVHKCTFKIEKPGKLEFAYGCIGETMSGGATIEIEFKVKPKLTCKINPTVGKSYSTQFQLRCQLDSEEIIQTIEVYLFRRALGDFVTTWAPPKDHRFRLPLNTTKILVRAMVHPKVYSYVVLNVTVKQEFPSNSSQKSMMKILDLYKGSGENSITSQLEKDKTEALGMINSLWKGINSMGPPDNKQFEEFLDNLKLHTIDNLLTVPVTTSDTLIQLNSAVKNILQNHNKSYPLMEKSLSIICKKLASDYEDMQNGTDLYFKATMSNIGIIKTLADCSVKTVHENYDLFKPLDKGEEQTTEKKQTVIETITEDYKEYVDFGEEYYHHLEDLEEAGSNILEIATTLAKAVADTMGPSGHKMYVSDKINVSVYQKPGTFYHKKLGARGVMIFPSRDVYRSKNNFVFTLLSWEKNIFWWTETKFKPNTFIADISFENMYTGQQVSDFASPHFVFFDMITSPPDLVSQIFFVTVPSAYRKQETNEEYMDNYIDIHRISVYRHQGVFVQFYDLRGQKFLVVIKNFELPVFDDFKRRGVILVNENNTFTSCENDNDYDSWYYVGILPHRDMVNSSKEDQTFKYNVSFSAPACYEFTFDQYWRRSCKGGVSTATEIVCKCSHLSILAGRIESAPSKKSEFSNTQLELEVESHQEIFWCVMFLFSVFCLVMLYGKRKHELYYAADNNYNDRYAYLIVVRTGRFRQLTSHIVMKIIGTKGHTPPHILNYPDPHHRIFQSGSEDWIVVTTANSIGDITSIELWHDNYGLKPTWYCKDIVIYDVQTEERWLFKINQTLSVCHEYRIKVAPIGISGKKIKQRFEVLSISSEHEIWNIFVDDIHHTMSYIQRLLQLYSKVLTPLVVTAVWQGLPAMENFDSVDPYNYYLDGHLFLMGFGSSFISFLVHSALLWWAPKHTIFFTIPSIIISNTILIIFGFWIPYYSSVRIILAWLFGIFLDWGVYKNLMALLRKLIYGVKLLETTKGISYENVKKQIDIQREALQKTLQSVFVFKLHQMAIPLKGKKFRHKKREDLRRTKLGQQFKDLVMFGIYIILLYAVVSIEKDHLVFRNGHVLRDAFEGRLSRTRNINQTQHMFDIYHYMITTLIDVMHIDTWYHKFHDEESGMLYDRSNKYIGVARIRQNRVRSKLCKLGDKNITCGPEFSESDEERRTFEEGWKRPTPYIAVSKRMTPMWIYSYAATTGAKTYLGLFAVYPGSGYVTTMGRNRGNSLTNLYNILQFKWIDRFTRSIFIEFLTYSANYNLFNSVRLVIERSATGLINSRVEVSSARMIYVGGELERRSLLITITFVIWLTVLFWNKTKFIIREPLTYLKNFWNLLDLTIIIISMCCIIIYVARVKSIGQLLNTIEKSDQNTFVNYFDLFTMHTTLNVIGAVLVCISTIRLWKLMRFFKMFRMFEKTFQLVMGPVLALFLHHIIFVTGCTILSHILFGEDSKDFLNYKNSFQSLGRIYLGLYRNYVFFVHIGSTLNMTLIVLYVIISKMFFATYLVICVLAHLDARELFTHQHEESYSFFDYLKEELMFLFTWLKLRKTHHHYTELPLKKQVIYPKPVRYLYANCISTTTHAMNAMAIVAAIVLYNKIHSNSPDGVLTEKQIELMLRVCHYFLSEHNRDHKEFFFTVHEGKTLKIVDAKRIDKEKHVVEMILGVSAKLEKRHKLNRQTVLRHALRDFDKVQKKLQICLHSLENIEFVEPDAK